MKREVSFVIDDSNRTFSNNALNHYKDFFDKNEQAIQNVETLNLDKAGEQNVKLAKSKLNYLKNTIAGIESRDNFKNLTEESKGIFRENIIGFLSSVQQADESRKNITVKDLGKNMLQLGKNVLPVVATTGVTFALTTVSSPLPLVSSAVGIVGGFATKVVVDKYGDQIKHFFNEVKQDVNALYDTKNYQDKNLVNSLANFKETKSVNVLDELYNNLRNQNVSLDDLSHSVKKMQAEIRKDPKNITNIDLDLMNNVSSKLQFKENLSSETKNTSMKNELWVNKINSENNHRGVQER